MNDMHMAVARMAVILATVAVSALLHQRVVGQAPQRSKPDAAQERAQRQKRS
jgi:hypothetical protein